MGQFSFWHLIFLFIIVLIFFGPTRLPHLGNSIGKAIRGFKEGLKGAEDETDGPEKIAQTAQEALPPGEKKEDTKINQTDKNQTRS